MIVSDRLELRNPPNKKSKGKATPRTSVIITPKKSDSVKYLRVRQIKSPSPESSSSLPGLPMDLTGLQYKDQHRDDWYQNYGSVRIDFGSEEGMS